MLLVKTYGSILVVSGIGLVLALTGKVAVAAVGVPFFLSLLLVEYAGARAGAAEAAVRREIEALRSAREGRS
jgi:hypothetical protein